MLFFCSYCILFVMHTNVRFVQMCCNKIRLLNLISTQLSVQKEFAIILLLLNLKALSLKTEKPSHQNWTFKKNNAHPQLPRLKESKGRNYLSCILTGKHSEMFLKLKMILQQSFSVWGAASGCSALCLCQCCLLRSSHRDRKKEKGKRCGCADWQLRILFRGLAMLWQMDLLHTSQCMTTYLKQRTETKHSSNICHVLFSSAALLAVTADSICSAGAIHWVYPKGFLPFRWLPLA